MADVYYTDVTVSDLEAAWLRGPAGTYKLTISCAGDQKTIDLPVP